MDKAGAYIDSLVRETWGDSGAFFFGFTQEDRELLNCRHGNIPSVVPSQKGLHTLISLVAAPVVHRRVGGQPFP